MLFESLKRFANQVTVTVIAGVLQYFRMQSFCRSIHLYTFKMLRQISIFFKFQIELFWNPYFDLDFLSKFSKPGEGISLQVAVSASIETSDIHVKSEGEIEEADFLLRIQDDACLIMY